MMTEPRKAQPALFAPGCALLMYKEKSANRLLDYLASSLGPIEPLLTCCRHTPRAAKGRRVINVCPGCDRRYRDNYEKPSTVSLWEVLAESRDFLFPDYGGRPMSIIDACPTRDQPRVHDAVRALAKRMNIRIVEPKQTRERSTCCGDTFYGRIPTDKVLVQMKAKAAKMPAEEILVYCVSCSKSMFNGGKRPRYLVDLLFEEETVPETFEPDAWHRELDEFIAAHTDEKE